MSNSSSWWSSNAQSDLSWWLAEDDDDNKDQSGFGKSEENEKDCSIYVIDCNEQMFSTDDEKSNSFSRCCQAIVNAFKRKIIQSKDDLVCVVLYNSRESKNPMNHNFIYLFNEPDTPSAKLIKNIRDLPLNVDEDIGSLSNDKQCDFRDLLWTLQNIFSEIDVQGTKFGSKRALIFTMNDNPLRKDNNATIAKGQDMLDAGIEISVFPLRKMISIKKESSNNLIKFDIRKFYMNICSLDLDELTNPLDLLNACATLDDLEDGLRTKEMKKRSLISCPFMLNPNNNIAIKMYCLYRRAIRDNAVWLDGRTNQPLTTETRWVCRDSGFILDDLSIKTYHEYSPDKMRIYFTKDEIKQLKTFGNPSLTLMGFKSLNRLKSYYNFKPSYFMYPDETRIEGSTLLFNTLLKAMIEKSKFGVARFIFRKIGGPRFVALLPQKEIIDSNTNEQEQPPGINIIFLPYADDIRKPEIKQIIRANNNDENENTIIKAKQIIEKLTLKGLSEPANPILQKHYDALEAIALDEDINNNDDDDYNDQIDGQGENIDEITPDDQAMLKLSGKEIEEFKNLVGLNGQPIPKTNKRTKKEANIGNSNGKRAKVARKNKNENASEASSFDWKKLADNDELKSLKVADLKIYLGDNGLRKTGKKADLVERIKQHLGV